MRRQGLARLAGWRASARGRTRASVGLDRPGCTLAALPGCTGLDQKPRSSSLHSPHCKSRNRGLLHYTPPTTKAERLPTKSPLPCPLPAERGRRLPQHQAAHRGRAGPQLPDQLLREAAAGPGGADKRALGNGARVEGRSVLRAFCSSRPGGPEAGARAGGAAHSVQQRGRHSATSSQPSPEPTTALNHPPHSRRRPLTPLISPPSPRPPPLLN